MNDDDSVLEPKRLQPHQLGWLRRPELDRENIDVWERPDGQLHAQEKGIPLVLNYLKWPSANEEG